MSANTRQNYFVPVALAYVGVPLLLWAVGDFPRRTVLKESLSLLTILAFCLMLGQFTLTRGTVGAAKAVRFATAMRLHKVIGYAFLGVLLVHPLLLVLPRLSESGVGPWDAFVTLVTTFDSRGVVLGIAAWCLLLALGITSLVRRHVTMKYRTGRILHGTLSTLFVSIATWHAVDLGRHTDTAMSVWMIALASFGIAFLLKGYLTRNPDNRRRSHA
ncbi:ferric reductase-like transmembrane domain-containing protein, partial [bacterium]|nr:ferric reductase-like transmembrane domain-containing protein [bacterium]